MLMVRRYSIGDYGIDEISLNPCDEHPLLFFETDKLLFSPTMDHRFLLVTKKEKNEFVKLIDISYFDTLEDIILNTDIIADEDDIFKYFHFTIVE